MDDELVLDNKPQAQTAAAEEPVLVDAVARIVEGEVDEAGLNLSLIHI